MRYAVAMSPRLCDSVALPPLTHTCLVNVESFDM